MTYQPLPTTSPGNVETASVADELAAALLGQIVSQLGTMNLYLSALSDIEIDEAI